MICPKCQKMVQEQTAQCPHCGVFFAKYAKYHPTENAQSNTLSDNIIIYNDDEEPEQKTHFLVSLCLEDSHLNSRIHLMGRGVIFVMLIIWGVRLITSSIDSNAVGESFLHLINLPFHEAGHIFFRPFGQFITSLGGTLGQLLMPLICMGTLLIKTRDPFGASVTLWWFGENFLDTAPYMNDARAGELPLIGGNFGHSAPYGFHDWEYLLTESHLIEYDHSLAKMVFVIGSIIMLLSLLWAGFILFKQYQAVRDL